jgi:cystine transport system permease protein
MLELLERASPLLLYGLWITVWLGVASFVLALVTGFVLAIARMFGPWPIRMVAATIVSIIRGTPLLTQILLIYYGLPQLGVTIGAIPSVILTLTVHAGTYISEDFRGGLLSVDKGQWEAGQSIGMPFLKVLRRIIVPQAVRVVTPSLGGRFVTLVKDTSLASVVTVVELTRVAEQVGSATFRYMEMFVIVAVIYWLVTFVLSLGQAALEHRMKRAYR